MTVAPNTILRVSLNFNLAGDSFAQTVHHYLYTGAGVLADTVVNDDFAFWANAMADYWEALGDDLATLQSTNVSQLNGGSFFPVGQAAILRDGQVPGDQVAHGVAALQRFTVAFSTGQARKFWPGVSDALFLNGSLNPAATGISTSWAAFQLQTVDAAINGGIVGEYIPGVLSNQLNEIFKQYSGTAFASTIAAYQRRRKPGVGA